VEILCGVLALALVERFVLAGPNAELALRLIEAALYFTFVGGLVVATFTDLEWMMIPDEVTLPGAALGLATVGLRETDVETMAIGAGVGYLVVQVLFVWSYERLTGRRGMGEGDAKLLLFVGAFTGWQGVLFAIAAGSMQGIVVAAISLATRKPLAPEEHAADDGPGNVRAKEPPPAKCVDVGGPVIEVTEAKVGKASPRDQEASEERAPEPPLRLRLPFGPFLALAALEWLFFGDRVVEWYLGFFEV